jgi:DnaJ family protein C protein 7
LKAVASPLPDVTRIEGAIYFLEGNFAPSRVLLKKYLISNPLCQTSRDLLVKMDKLEELKKNGNEYFKQGQFDQAISLYSEAIKIDSNSIFRANLFCNRGAAYMSILMWSKALEDCNQALQIDPMRLRSLERRIECEIKLEQYFAAVADLKKASKMDPSRADEFSRKISELEQKQNSKQSTQTHYDTLGLSQNATESEIKVTGHHRFIQLLTVF